MVNQSAIGVFPDQEPVDHSSQPVDRFGMPVNRLGCLSIGLHSNLQKNPGQPVSSSGRPYTHSTRPDVQSGRPNLLQ